MNSGTPACSAAEETASIQPASWYIRVDPIGGGLSGQYEPGGRTCHPSSVKMNGPDLVQNSNGAWGVRLGVHVEPACGMGTAGAVGVEHAEGVRHVG